MDFESVGNFDAGFENANSGSPEVSKEQQEKQSESSKKAAAGIARTQKDEGKAKKHDFMLAKFLVAILLNKKYDFLHGPMFALLDAGYPSNFILGIISLLYTPISFDIRDVSQKARYVFTYTTNGEIQDFHDQHLDEQVKKRVNYWIEDIIDVISITPSSLATAKLQHLIHQDETQVLEFISQVFIFFLSENNLTISENKAKSYSLFILQEVKKTLDNLNLEEV